jgi:endonuclease/exonuclease/phosphatase family metal-dependent hydrolase
MKNYSTKVLRTGSAILFSFLLIQGAGLALAQDLTVMTRNLYLGAEIQSLAAATSPEDFIAGVKSALERIGENNFPERAVALASEIKEKKPDLVALQEVYNFTINGFNAQPPFCDYLDDLLTALEDQGASYYVAATVKNLDLSVPFENGLVGVVDRDVILAHQDVATTVIDPNNYCPAERISLDGCNYGVVAVANTPVGEIAFKRGYVGIITPYGYFFNTHLEVRNPDPSEPLSPLVQRYQALELISVLENINLAIPAPTIVAGDINSSPGDIDAVFGLYSPYKQFEVAEYWDTWKLRPGKPKGYTCCFYEDLSIPGDLYERIDMVFTSVEPSRVKANVVGNDASDQTTSGLWPSDHAGVVTRIKF